MRSVAAKFDKGEDRVRRVVDVQDLAGEWQPDLAFAVLVRSTDERTALVRWQQAGLMNVQGVEAELLEPGDVIVASARRTEASVLFRESDRHHAIFLTNRCNSKCLMCSQPPTPQDDSWLAARAGEVIRHVRTAPGRLGLTGGEPLLLGAALRRILDNVGSSWPATHVEVLTNGRLLADEVFARNLLGELRTPTSWLVPLYGHADFIHDFVVQSPGAFEETIAGLLSLQEYGQRTQLRIVLIKTELEHLESICEFIGRNLPFVKEVALMACEPIGYALANRDEAEVDLAEWSETLLRSTRVLLRHRVPFLFMNAPLCSLPRALWPWARQSISDWKNVHVDECSRCSVKESCSGLFAWHQRGWAPAAVRAIEEIQE